MNKKFLSAILFGALTVASTSTFVSCKDYDDDIDNLQEQITANKATIDQIQALLDKGVVIESVVQDGAGVTLKTSDGNSYTLTNGKDGVNGVDGKDATVWTIGNDGYWYQNGTKTDYKAVGIDGKDGVDGKDGANGKDGKDGADGKDGKDGATGAQGPVGPAGATGAAGQDGKDGKNGGYYVPNTETGYFDYYEDGKLVTAGNAENGAPSWKASQKSVNAILNGNTLTLTNVNGNETPVVLDLGTALGSVAFVPVVVSETLPYATTTKEFLHLTSYYDESKFNASTKVWTAQNSFNKSNVIDMLYRLNPEDAYVKGALVGFVNRNVTTRAVAGDKSDLLAIKDTVISNGTVNLNVTVNASKLNSNQQDIAALQVWSGQNPVTSDFVHIKSTKIDVVLADSGKTTAGQPAKIFYARNKKIQGSDETDAFVKSFVALTDAANYEMTYNASIDLNKVVGLYSDVKLNWLAKLGFVGMSYEFSIPKEYKSDDTQKTNQQWFIRFKDGQNGVVEANAANLTNGLTPAIGRTPVVRVDAFLTDNQGVKRLVASSYIKLNIVSEIDPGPGPAKLPYNMAIETSTNNKELEYHNLTGSATWIAQKPWTEINNEIYGQTGLTSTTFWSYYGGTADEYEVKVTTTNKSGNTETLTTITGTKGTNTVVNGNGINLEVLLNDGETQTSNIKLGVNNEIKTENTYKDVNGKGAEYKVIITIKSDNIYTKGNVVLTQTFYVREDCKSFDYNPLYYVDNHIEVKGQLNASNTWEMSTAVNEHFVRKNGKNIFEYYNTVQNVTEMTFAWKTGTTGVSAAPIINTDGTYSDEIRLTEEMKTEQVTKNLTYKTKLVNGEYCNFSYDIVFINPFVAGSAAGIQIQDKIGESTGETAPQVLVKDTEGDDIYKWITNALALTSKATGTYKVAAPSVTFAFVRDASYTELTSNISAKSKLEVDAATGKVTWLNQGSALKKDFALTVKATVTFEDLSVVECLIPVKLVKK